MICLLGSCSSAHYGTQREPGTLVASWYGHEFQGRQTASGERYDMNALTCAHREYPFGTMVKVTNIAGGKSVQCTVNDRGPFISGRDIDLSYAAAKEIDLIGPGTAIVRIEELGRDSAYVKEVRYLPAGGGTSSPFTIQVGSFRELDNAQHLKDGLDLKYKGVFIAETVIDNSTFYRVRIGKFSGRGNAFRFAKTLAEEGYSPIIMHYDDRI